MWVRIPAPAGSPRLFPRRCTVGCPLLQVCTLGWVKCREHISLLIILCIIVYVTNKAHPSYLSCIPFSAMYHSAILSVWNFLRNLFIFYFIYLYSFFESHLVTIYPLQIHFVVVYRTPGPLSNFMEELDVLLSAFPEDGTPLVMLGDFNIHLNKPLQTSTLALPLLISREC